MPSANERILSLYEENAVAWDLQRGRELFERPWMERFASLLPPQGSILDIGCGMGEPIADFFIGQGFRVTGVDSSPSLIGMCRDRFPEQEWKTGDMRQLDLGQRFDGLIAWHSFFHLSPDDQRRTLPLFSAHTMPDGILMITTGPSAGEEIGTWQDEALYHGSLSSEEYHSLLANNGFRVIDHVVSDPECGHATIWLARRSGSPCLISG